MKLPSELFGQLLKVKLNSGLCKREPFPENAIPFMGGRSFNVWYLYQNLPEKTDPGSPENILAISCGFLTGSSAPASARLHINALSPLTRILGSSNIGGFAGSYLRSCDISSVIISGKSKIPVYLYIDSQGASLKDASSIWGLDAFSVQDKLKDIHVDKKIKILTIGQGGEKEIPFAAIMTEKDHAAGRTGMGAVMGSKNLKAIVIEKGSHTHLKATSERQKKAVRSYLSAIRGASEFHTFSTYGGAGYVEWVNESGFMTSKNYKKIGVTGDDRIDGKELIHKVVKKSGCFKCPVQCKAELKLSPDSKEVFTRPEFEPFINLGPKCGLSDSMQIIRLDNLCGKYGLDITSASGVIAFAMDLFEQNKLPRELVGDLDLSWGNAEVMETLIHQMIDGKGLGKILSKGVKQASEEIGEETYEHAIHVKGLELTAYHPGAIMGTALGYAISSRGGDYNNIYASLEYSWSEDQAEKEFGTREAVNIKSIQGKGLLIKKAVSVNIMVDSLGLCKVPVLSLLKSFNLEREANLLEGLTGYPVSAKELIETGARLASLERLFNIRHSQDKQEDVLPGMFMGNKGQYKIKEEDFKTMLMEFYTAMGWDKNGVPEDTGL